MANQNSAGEPYPMVGLYFSVSFSDIPNSDDTRFMEVSGISMTLGINSVKEGGDNNSEISLPGKTSFSDLTLKRGMLPSSSQLRDWCYSWLLKDYSKKIEKKTVFLKLLDKTGSPILGWQFQEAFPYKLEIGKLDAMAGGSSAILVETIILRYSDIKLLDV
ncbi:MAG: phage tail protein [Bacteroidota bacterium]